jgi:hypothetical protein
MWLFRMTKRWHAWLAKKRLVTKMFTRVSSFAELTKIVQTGHAAAVQPPPQQSIWIPSATGTVAFRRCKPESLF